MPIDDYAERNRAAWNQVAPIHRKHRKTDLAKAVQAADFSLLDDTEKAVLTRLQPKGKTVAQLCCNNGRELISVLKMGAAAGVGFDISDESVEEAQKLGALSKTDATFVRTHIYDIAPSYHNRFDLVYITIGALCWFDDLNRFFSVAAQLLRPGGQLFIYEMHPILNIFALPGEPPYDSQEPFKLAYPYFKDDPFIDTNGLDYVGQTQYDAKPTYSFQHTLATIFTAILTHDLTITDFAEHPHDISASFPHAEEVKILPMSYTLVAQKKPQPHL